MQGNHSPLNNTKIEDVHRFTFSSMDRCLRDFTFTIGRKSVIYLQDTNLSRQKFMTEVRDEKVLTFVVGLRTSSWKKLTQKFCSARHTGSSSASALSRTSSKRCLSAASTSTHHWSRSTPSKPEGWGDLAGPPKFWACCFNFPVISWFEPLPLPDAREVWKLTIT